MKASLYELNSEIFREFMKQYKEEQEKMMRVSINVAAYQISTLDQVNLSHNS